jgi:penicillin-binding protein 1B
MARYRIGLPKAVALFRKRRPAGRSRKRGRGWKFYVLVGLGVPFLLLAAVTTYYYLTFSRMIDARMHGEFLRTDPRIFARPFEIRRGQSLTPHQLVERLNDLGYSQRAKAERPGEFTIGQSTLLVIPRDGEDKARLMRVHFVNRGKDKEPSGIATVEEVGTGKKSDHLQLDSPLITALVTTAREKRRDVPLAKIPQRMIQAVLAIEDRRFYDHPGVDPIAVAAVVFEYVTGKRTTMRGASTLTQQLVKNTFLSQDRSPKRKLQEWIMSVALERRLSKDQLLELYLNDVWLGQRGSFAVHGVPEAARLFFSKDISNVTLTEAATIAGVIQSPPRHSPFNNPERSKERRNVVLKAMVDAGFITPDAASRAASEPLHVVARALENEAPYFVDLISQELQDTYKVTGAVDVYTTLDVHLQKLAQDAVRDGLTRVDEILARRKRQRAQAALVAIDPRTGEILALVGGRSYNQSQFNRAVSANRQPGSVFKPFVYLAAFEHAVRRDPRLGRARRTDIMGSERRDLDPEQLRRRVRRADHAAPGAGAVPQHRRDQGRRIGRLRRGRRPVAAGRGRHPAAAVPVDRARRLRSHAAPGGQCLHPVPQRRVHPRAPRHLAHRQGREGRGDQERRSAKRRPAGHHVPRDQHDAQRHQRGDRRRCPCRRLHA